MSNAADPIARAKTTLPLILAAAVVQGWALYGLHHALANHHWPATQEAWLTGLYAVAVFIPTTLQLTAAAAHRPVFWRCIAGMTFAFLYFGMVWGWVMPVPDAARSNFYATYFAVAFQLAVLWLLMLPFLQRRLQQDRWSGRYDTLVVHAWRNKLVLLEASIFTGGFWLLLELWQALFHMLRIDFFRELFQSPIFAYPVTALTFGCALHLIGSVEAMTGAVLAQILNVLKWLGLLAGVILALFTVALLSHLPDLVFTHHRAIDTTWLLWLVAFFVLLLNAAYRDGSVPRPYPRWIAVSLRWVTPLTVVVTITALYALIVRAHLYGLTVERFWALVVAFAAFGYAVGYSVCAWNGERWFGGMSQVNTAMAVALIVVLSAALTPALSPFRLAAISQYHRARNVVPGSGDANVGFGSAFHYLRFDTGDYGRAKLEILAGVTDGPNAQTVRSLAREALATENPWNMIAESVEEWSPEKIARIPLHPAGRTMDARLNAAILADLRLPGRSPYGLQARRKDLAGIFADLRGDGTEQFVLIAPESGAVFERKSGTWARVATVSGPFQTLGAWLANQTTGRTQGQIETQRPAWNELVIAGRRFTVRSD